MACPIQQTGGSSVCFFAPIKDREGKLLGVLFTTHLANNEFSDILSSIHFGKRGETYAFDKQGRMLSSSRFLTDLRKMDFFKLAENDESIYNVILKNPGVDLSKGLVPKKNWYAASLCKAGSGFIVPTGNC
jgi:hypothetical protein